MNRRAVVTLVLYALAIASWSIHESWVLGVLVLVAAHIGLGVGVGRAWVLAVPIGLTVLWFALSGAEGTAYLTLILGAPLSRPPRSAGRSRKRRSVSAAWARRSASPAS